MMTSNSLTILLWIVLAIPIAQPMIQNPLMSLKSSSDGEHLIQPDPVSEARQSPNNEIISQPNVLRSPRSTVFEHLPEKCREFRHLYFPNCLSMFETLEIFFRGEIDLDLKSRCSILHLCLTRSCKFEDNCQLFSQHDKNLDLYKMVHHQVLGALEVEQVTNTIKSWLSVPLGVVNKVAVDVEEKLDWVGFVIGVIILLYQLVLYVIEMCSKK